MSKPLIIILSCNNSEEISMWEKACEKKSNKIKYEKVNLLSQNWLESIEKNYKISLFLTKPPGVSAFEKQVYDERLVLLSERFNVPFYPSIPEVLIYENKRYLSSWLNVHKIPHPKTYVFFRYKEALKIIKDLNFPLVAKVNIGASGSGVKILKYINDAEDYIEKTFKGEGIKRRSGPNLDKRGLFKRGLHYVIHPKDILKKLRIYKSVRREKQSGFVLFQEYIPHLFEWRVVRIGDSFFAHKKLKINEKTSGSLLKDYENPPIELFDFVKKITDEHSFYSQAIDIFESERGYLVNEMQCIFGQSDQYQMLVDGMPGRYKYEEGSWVFEEGNFASNQCYDLRLEYIMENLE